MYGVKGLLRQGVAQFVRAAGERGQRRGTIDRDANIREAVGAAKFAKGECHAVAQRQPVRRQFVLLHQGRECRDDRIAWRQIEHGIAELARPLPGEIGFGRIDLDRLE
jgi:hypothetical protein